VLPREIITVARGYSGHLGVEVLRPQGGGTYQIIFRYRSPAEQQMWNHSEQRRRLVARIDELLDDGATAQVRYLDGEVGVE